MHLEQANSSNPYVFKYHFIHWLHQRFTKQHPNEFPLFVSYSHRSSFQYSYSNNFYILCQGCLPIGCVPLNICSQWFNNDHLIGHFRLKHSFYAFQICFSRPVFHKDAYFFELRPVSKKFIAGFLWVIVPALSYLLFGHVRVFFNVINLLFLWQANVN